MSLTFSQTPGNGVNLSFPITNKGGYFNDEDIVVEFITLATGEVAEQSPSTYEISSGFVIFTVAPPDTVDVRIRRRITLDNPYSTFARGNEFGKDNINKSFLQALYQVQQIADGFLPSDHYLKADLNAGARKITNLADGTDPQDACTYGQMDNRFGDNTQNLLDAQEAQAAAEAAQHITEGLRDDASISETNAGISETNAAQSAQEAYEYLQTIESVNPENVAQNTIHRQITSGNPHGITAAMLGAINILNELLVVGGDGSGLDSDKTDGYEASDMLGDVGSSSGNDPNSATLGYRLCSGANCPLPQGSWYIHTMTYNDGTYNNIAQKAIRADSYVSSYVRIKYEGVWSKWVICSGSQPGDEIYLPYEPSSEEMLARRMLEKDGSSLLRSDYPELFNKIGTMYGYTDSTHFNLPDDRGLFIRMYNNGAGVDPDAASRTNRGDGTTGDAVGTLQDSQLPNHQHSLVTSTGIETGPSLYRLSGSITGLISSITTGAETRPKNIYKWGGIFY